MAWLSSLVAAVLASLLERLVGDVVAYVTKQKALEAQRAATQAEAQASVEPLKKAQTAEEIDAAANSSLNGL